MRTAAVLTLAALVSSSALANGRFPATRDVLLDDSDGVALVPATFGLLVGDGDKLRWVCEDALGYSGTYDPTYAVTENGWWLTTFDGVRVSRDEGCTWQAVGAPFDELFPGDMKVDGSGALWVVTAQAGQTNGLYRNASPASSTTFTTTGLAATDAVLTSLAVSADGMTIYVAGFELPPDPQSDPTALLMRSTDGGSMWTTLSVDDLQLAGSYQIFLEGVDPDSPAFVLVRVPRANGGGDALYLSDDSGDSFSLGVQVEGAIDAVVVRNNGAVVVGAGSEGVFIRAAGAGEFVAQESGLQLGCVVETSDETLIGCGNNWAPDLAALATSSDGNTWSELYRFDDVVAPLDCAPGTVQHDVCAAELWAGLQQQLGMEPGVFDAGPDAGPGSSRPTDGCGCRAAGSGSLGGLLALVSLVLLSRRRARRRR